METSASFEARSAPSPYPTSTGRFIGAPGAARLEPVFTKGGTYVYGVAPEIEDLFRRQANELDHKRRDALLHQIQKSATDRVRVAPLYQQTFPGGWARGSTNRRRGSSRDFPIPAPSRT